MIGKNYKINRTLKTGVGALAVLLLGAILSVSPSLQNHSAANNGSNRRLSGWPSWQYDSRGSRFNEHERAIRPDTVSRLSLKWAWAGPINQVEMHSQPAVVGDTAYVGGQDANLYALDAKTGKQKWVYDTRPIAGPVPPIDTSQPFQIERNPLRDGPAVHGDTVYFGDYRGHVYAVNRHNGQLRWASKVHDHPFAVLTSSPLFFDGRIYIGVSSNEPIRAGDPDFPCCTFRGKVVALDAKTGGIDWAYYTVPQPIRNGNWPGTDTPRYEASGAGAWASPAIDPKTRTVFFGTGNNYSGIAGDVDSLVAVDADTGKKRWGQRLTFPDTWNLACVTDPPGPACPYTEHPDTDVASPNVFRGHNGRTLVGVGQKATPKYRAFDAKTGELVWEANIRNGVQWGSAYDGEKIYVGTANDPTDIEDNREPGVLHALDPATGKIVWETAVPENGCATGGAAAFPEQCQLLISAAASASPGLVYAGSYDGKMRIYSSEDGNLLWEYDTIREFDGVNGQKVRGGSISGGGGAVIANGMLYVNSGYEFDGGIPGNVLLAFGLNKDQERN